jgi:peptidoglycan/xylan/chitin deacetylase (PgdA/CDA1 family)
MLSLTFDDGPDRRWTARVLAALERCRARATFFMVGERVQATPEVAAAVIASGCEVQLHCHRHIRHTELSETAIEEDTLAALEALASIGVHPSQWRTPWGIRTAATERVARRHRLTLLDWTIDTHDWRGDPAAAMLDRARAQLADGGVVLMHDALGPGALREGCENTVDLLPSLIAAARARGIHVGPLGLAGPVEDGRAASPLGTPEPAEIASRT